jgi:hypothetical protein
MHPFCLCCFWKKAPYVFRALVLAALFYVMGSLISSRMAGQAVLGFFLLLIPFLLSILFGWKSGVFALGGGGDDGRIWGCFWMGIPAAPVVDTTDPLLGLSEQWSFLWRAFSSWPPISI